MDYAFEQRLEGMKEEARRKGQVEGQALQRGGRPTALPGLPGTEASLPGYFGLPIIKPPVWKWMIPAYFFIGGVAGMSAAIAMGGMIVGDAQLIRVAMWIAVAGAIISPILLAWDLGRPLRFIYMLRVFKPQSPMSVGSWIISAFGANAIAGAILIELYVQNISPTNPVLALHILSHVFVVISALLGVFMATYTGALIGVTAIPAWFTHRALLPVHFGTVALGSAAALLILIGFRHPAFIAFGLAAAALVTAMGFWLLIRRHGEADRALHRGSAGLILQLAEVLAGPLALALWLISMPTAASISFLLGGILDRYGWLQVGRSSACRPEAVFASQAPGGSASK